MSVPSNEFTQRLSDGKNVCRAYLSEIDFCTPFRYNFILLCRLKSIEVTGIQISKKTGHWY